GKNVVHCAFAGARTYRDTMDSTAEADSHRHDAQHLFGFRDRSWLGATSVVAQRYLTQSLTQLAYRGQRGRRQVAALVADVIAEPLPRASLGEHVALVSEVVGVDQVDEKQGADLI